MYGEVDRSLGEIEQYIIMALALSGTLGIIGAASHPVLAREGQMAIGALCLLSLAVPIVGALSALFELPQFDFGEAEVAGDSVYAKTVEAAFVEGARAYVAAEYGLDASEVAVDIDGFDELSMRAEFIKITLSGGAAFANVTAIREAVRSELVAEGGECKVVIDFDG